MTRYAPYWPLLLLAFVGITGGAWPGHGRGERRAGKSDVRSSCGCGVFITREALVAKRTRHAQACTPK